MFTIEYSHPRLDISVDTFTEVAPCSAPAQFSTTEPVGLTVAPAAAKPPLNNKQQTKTKNNVI